jgi:dihydroorotate dehydrogenase (fumarate)
MKKHKDMKDLKTNYMGIELKNPIVIGASNLSGSIQHLKHLEEAGAGAIVYKSLFEEQIQLENFFEEEAMNEYNDRNAEMINIYPEMKDAGPVEFLSNLKKAKEALNIPLIASLNCVYKETWVDYAKQIEATGVDGLELNFYAAPREFGVTAQEIQEEQLQITAAVKAAINIPIAVKLSPYYTNTLRFAHLMDGTGIDAMVMFNRLFQPDIDIDNELMSFNFNKSGKGDYRLPLRYMGLLHNKVKANLVANSGILEGQDVVKMLLAGADAVQIVSTLYQNGLDYLKVILEDLEKWMDKKGYNSISEFRGKLSKENTNDRYAYKRAQYVDILMKSVELYKPNKMV